jgi:hypothetical protein
VFLSVAGDSPSARRTENELHSWNSPSVEGMPHIPMRTLKRKEPTAAMDWRRHYLRTQQVVEGSSSSGCWRTRKSSGVYLLTLKASTGMFVHIDELLPHLVR